MQTRDFVTLHSQKINAKYTEISGEEISKIFIRDEDAAVETAAKHSLKQVFRNLTVESLTKGKTYFIGIDNIEAFLSKEKNHDPVILKTRVWLLEEIQRLIRISFSDNDKQAKIVVFFFCSQPEMLDTFWTKSIIQKAIFLDFQSLMGLKVSIAASVKAFEKSFSLYKSAAEWVDGNNDTFVNVDGEPEDKPITDDDLFKCLHPQDYTMKPLNSQYLDFLFSTNSSKTTLMGVKSSRSCFLFNEEFDKNVKVELAKVEKNKNLFKFYSQTGLTEEDLKSYIKSAYNSHLSDIVKRSKRKFLNFQKPILNPSILPDSKDVILNLNSLKNFLKNRKASSIDEKKANKVIEWIGENIDFINFEQGNIFISKFSPLSTPFFFNPRYQIYSLFSKIYQDTKSLSPSNVMMNKNLDRKTVFSLLSKINEINSRLEMFGLVILREKNKLSKVYNEINEKSKLMAADEAKKNQMDSQSKAENVSLSKLESFLLSNESTTTGKDKYTFSLKSLKEMLYQQAKVIQESEDLLFATKISKINKEIQDLDSLTASKSDAKNDTKVDLDGDDNLSVINRILNKIGIENPLATIDGIEYLKDSKSLEGLRGIFEKYNDLIKSGQKISGGTKARVESLITKYSALLRKEAGFKKKLALSKKKK